MKPYNRRKASDGIMKELKQDDIRKTILALAQSFDDELMAKTQAGLEDYWFFKFSPELSREQNLYEFQDMLKLYGGFCSRWEEAKNGSCYIVERVRDTYLMPKINQFVLDMEAMRE